MTQSQHDHDMITTKPLPPLPSLTTSPTTTTSTATTTAAAVPNTTASTAIQFTSSSDLESPSVQWLIKSHPFTVNHDPTSRVPKSVSFINPFNPNSSATIISPLAGNCRKWRKCRIHKVFRSVHYVESQMETAHKRRKRKLDELNNIVQLANRCRLRIATDEKTINSLQQQHHEKLKQLILLKIQSRIDDEYQQTVDQKDVNKLGSEWMMNNGNMTTSLTNTTTISTTTPPVTILNNTTSGTTATSM